MIDEGLLFGRGISFPPRVGADGRLTWSSGPLNVAEAIRVILLSQPGERVMLPEFGSRLHRFVYETNTVATRRLVAEEIQKALKKWEPRVELAGVDVEPDPADDRAVFATVRYRVVANRADEQLQVRVSLGG